jgi:hypothetical protein
MEEQIHNEVWTHAYRRKSRSVYILNAGYYRIDSDIYLLPLYLVVPKLSSLMALHKQLIGWRILSAR